MTISKCMYTTELADMSIASKSCHYLANTSEFIKVRVQY